MEIKDRVYGEMYLTTHPEMREALETGMIEGVRFVVLPGDIEEGDTYLAERNNGLKLLTCASNNRDEGWIVPKEIAYVFDTPECVKIELQI